MLRIQKPHDERVTIAKLTIGSLDDQSLTVEAQYNPKEIDLAKQATWKDHTTIQGRMSKRDDDVLDLEFTGNPQRTMTLELLFDGYEDHASVEPEIARLQRMMSPRDENSSDPHLRRPHLCVAVWNGQGIPRFECVIEAIAVKYTMFSRGGLPVRATCNVTLKEVRIRPGFPRAR